MDSENANQEDGAHGAQDGTLPTNVGESIHDMRLLRRSITPCIELFRKKLETASARLEKGQRLKDLPEMPAAIVKALEKIPDLQEAWEQVKGELQRVYAKERERDAQKAAEMAAEKAAEKARESSKATGNSPERAKIQPAATSTGGPPPGFWEKVLEAGTRAAEEKLRAEIKARNTGNLHESKHAPKATSKAAHQSRHGSGARPSPAPPTSKPAPLPMRQDKAGGPAGQPPKPSAKAGGKVGGSTTSGSAPAPGKPGPTDKNQWSRWRSYHDLPVIGSSHTDKKYPNGRVPWWWYTNDKTHDLGLCGPTFCSPGEECRLGSKACANRHWAIEEEEKPHMKKEFFGRNPQNKCFSGDRFPPDHPRADYDGFPRYYQDGTWINKTPTYVDSPKVGNAWNVENLLTAIPTEAEASGTRAAGGSFTFIRTGNGSYPTLEEAKQVSQRLTSPTTIPSPEKEEEEKLKEKEDKKEDEKEDEKEEKKKKKAQKKAEKEEKGGEESTLPEDGKKHIRSASTT